jgi:hypothetical protein
VEVKAIVLGKERPTAVLAHRTIPFSPAEVDQYPRSRAARSSTVGTDHAVRARRRSALRPAAYKPDALIQNAADRMAYNSW